MSEEPDDPRRCHNLWEPVPGDHGAHGRFDRRAVTRSRQFWATTHRPLLAAAAVGARRGWGSGWRDAGEAAVRLGNVRLAGATMLVTTRGRRRKTSASTSARSGTCAGCASR
jgi:hypothetical protein